VEAVPERDVLAPGPVQDENVGVCEPRRVAVGRGEHQQHGVARAHRALPDHGGPAGLAPDELVGSDEPEQLVHRVRPPACVPRQQLTHVGQIDQPHRTVGDQAAAVLVSGDQQQDDVGEQLLPAQPIVGLASEQASDHVVLIGRPVPLEDRRDEAGQALRRGADGDQLLGGEGADIPPEREQEIVAPTLQPSPLLLAKTDAEQFTQHRDRERLCLVVHQIRARPCGVEQPLGHHADLVGEPLDRRRDEGSAEEARTRVCSGGSENTRLEFTNE
jgi:hypothetical protein